MVKSRSLLTLIAILAFFIPRVNGQENYPMEDLNGYLLKALSSNECLNYLQDTSGRSDTYFKSVTEIKYVSKDSLITDKKIESKKTYRFNRKGQITSFVTTDTIGKLTDSAIAFYDDKFHPLGIKEYRFEEDQGKLTLQGEIIGRYDEKGNCIWLKNWTYRPNQYRELDVKTDKLEDDSTIEISATTYNDFNKPIKTVISDNKGDTTFLFCTYNANKKLSTAKGLMKMARDGGTSSILQMRMRIRTGDYAADSYFMKFDDNGNLIQSVEFGDKDTMKNEINTYDETSRLITKITYKNGKLQARKKIVYGSEAERTETTENFGSAGDMDDDESSDYSEYKVAPTSCVINSTTVDVYNNFGDIDSDKVSITSNGKPSVKTTAHKYLYNYFGKALSDSELVVEQSEYHSSGTLSVNYYKYDNWGNMLEKIGKGGEGTSADVRTTYTYNPQNRMLSEEDYGSCLDTPFATYKIKYYPDGSTEKEIETSRGANHYIYRFGEDTRKTENINSTTYGIEQTVYEYQNW